MNSKKKRTNRRFNVQSKRRRQAAPLKSKTTKLDDLNDDVLVVIFKKMELVDVLNMADTSKQFKPAVERTLIRKMKKVHFDINCVESNNVKISEEQHLASIRKLFLALNLHEKTYVHDLFVALKLLRHFGHLISDLTIEYSTEVSQHVRDKLSRYVSEYCSRYVNTLTLVNCRKEDMKIFGKPFSRTREVTLSNNRLISEGTCLNECFPKASSLILNEVTMTDSKCIAVNFPDLKCLKFRRVSITSNSLLTCLRLNPQIRKLQTRFFGVPKFLQNISEYVPNLEHLQLDHNLKSMSGFNEFHNSFKFLQSIYIRMGRKFNSQHFISFIVRHPTIRSLCVRTFSPAVNILTDDKAFLLSVRKCLPYLEQAQFLGFTISVEAIYWFLSEADPQKFSHFSCKLEDDSRHNDLRSRLGNEWNTYLSESNLHVNRKNIDNMADVFALAEFGSYVLNPFRNRVDF